MLPPSSLLWPLDPNRGCRSEVIVFSFCEIWADNDFCSLADVGESNMISDWDCLMVVSVVDDGRAGRGRSINGVHISKYGAAWLLLLPARKCSSAALILQFSDFSCRCWNHVKLKPTWSADQIWRELFSLKYTYRSSRFLITKSCEQDILVGRHMLLIFMKDWRY